MTPLELEARSFPLPTYDLVAEVLAREALEELHAKARAAREHINRSHGQLLRRARERLFHVEHPGVSSRNQSTVDKSTGIR